MLTFNNSRILVTGGAGFVGSNLCHTLLKEEPKEIIIVDNLMSADMINVPINTKVTFHLGSITEDKILQALPSDLDFAFHLATYHGNQSSIADPLADHENNTLTNLKLFNRIKDFKSLKKVVYSAAGCAVAEKTYDDAKATAEDAPVSLYHDSPYSISKLIGELYGNYYQFQYGLPFVKARFQNVYGPREILGAGRWRGTVNTVWRNVTPTFIHKALNREALPLENAGNTSRDFIFVSDIVDGLIKCALHGEIGGIYNLASGVETTILELASEINRQTQNPSPPTILPSRDWDRSGKRFGSTGNAKDKLGFEAKVSLSEGIRITVEWYKKNLSEINRCIRQHDFFIKKAND